MAPFSEYAMHVLVGEKDAPTTVENAILKSMGDWVVEDDNEDENENDIEYENDNSIIIPPQVQTLTPRQLVQLGAIWYLTAAEYQHNLLELPNSVHKPTRLSSQSNATIELKSGDYLRIHHTPRRFTRVYQSHWNTTDHDDHDGSANNQPPSVIVASGPGFWIIDKPPLIPVHATVDNAVENIVHQLHSANHEEDYVVTTQRLDINTSGLLVVATTPQFAAYFAQLLRLKTQQGIQDHIEKGYKCLVCLQPNHHTDHEQESESESVYQVWQRLTALQNTTIRHYLEPSQRAPKRFEAQALDDSWLECLLRITDVSPIYPIPTADHPLAQSLWTAATHMPHATKAVCELTIQLETGRTHQIRGQLAKLGFSLVGDEHYGGAIPIDKLSSTTATTKTPPPDPQLLALQCSKVGFRDADYTEVWKSRRRKNIPQGIPSADRWIEASLDQAWWTPLLLQQQQQQQDADDDSSITSAHDAELLLQTQEIRHTKSSDSTSRRPDLLPPTVQLSPGCHKYVIVQVKDDKEQRWFVKSASPKECGGPYHANVANELVEWIIQAAGYKHEEVLVTGGGRIDYSPDNQRALVYGFSYGYGKGDHAKAAQLITDSGILATHDDSNALY
jgi:23S rRNA-/tRNA-specific pseudouridylate synthase